MKPKKTKYDPQGDLFRPELCRIVDPKHPLVKLGRQINWQSFDEYFDQYYAEEGRPGVETRLMVSLHYLKYTYDLSDEDVVAQWKENVYWQYFSGRQFYEYKDPIEPSSMTRWRKRIGEAGAQQLLKETVLTGIKSGYLKKRDCEKVNVDTTVQTKSVRFPTDARLYNRVRERLVKAAEKDGLNLRQNYKIVGKKALQRYQNYSHARQMKRAKKQLRFLKTILGRVVRDIERKASVMSDEMIELMDIAQRALSQTKKSKNKVYSVHEPDVECICKGKVNQRYEFGCKVGIITTAKTNWILGTQAYKGNPYDGDTLEKNLEQAQDISEIAIKQAVVDQGYRGRKVEDILISVVPRNKQGKKKKLRHWWRRRNAIEPVIGHLKSEHRLANNKLAGQLGDQMNAILASCGFNFKKLLKAFWALFRNQFFDHIELNFQRAMI